MHLNRFRQVNNSPKEQVDAPFWRIPPVHTITRRNKRKYFTLPAIFSLFRSLMMMTSANCVDKMNMKYTVQIDDI